MLRVKTPDEALEIIQTAFRPLERPPEQVPLSGALGRVLARNIEAGAYVPGFCRSTVDGYAVRAADTFGCSDAMPALLIRVGEVAMGEGTALRVESGTCAVVPTGGMLPAGADAVQMLEYAEDYGDGTVGILKSAAPGHNLIFRGDDVKPGDMVLRAGRRLEPQDIGALAALGWTEVPAAPRVRVGVISTGDELVAPGEVPGPGQVRDVNSGMLAALMAQAGADCVCFGIVRDEEELLRAAVVRALETCDLVLISGGSSVGAKDAACRVLESLGEVLFHGVAMKPGKPTLLGSAGGRPVLGLPGHPVAALFCAHLFACPLVFTLEGRRWRRRQVTARLAESVGANHGRAQYTGVLLRAEGKNLWAEPIRSKSGLITALAGADGYFCIPRDCEGAPAGLEVSVTIFGTD